MQIDYSIMFGLWVNSNTVN